ncbi:BgTH12-02471 [Blumeria graminis f. sp. triticale]|uniref:Bgt-4620-2 n=3 Tax=Blumeria graminis TaxID=34373 RepID=A0A9X9MHJ6_BLUGR|nr:BgTH12-02471 [Blumeria graminis f. sp. triticale]VDB86302.1 Bgt-4620-2 [Blumeria graminis f. sp. tritici]
MVSFSCEACGDVLTKKKLDAHRNQCHGASYTCLDCMVHFSGFEYRAHTSCISEAQKYQGALYRPGKEKKTSQNNPTARGFLSLSNNNIVRPQMEALSQTPAVKKDAPFNVFDFLDPTSTTNTSRVELSLPEPMQVNEDISEKLDKPTTREASQSTVRIAPETPTNNQLVRVPSLNNQQNETTSKELRERRKEKDRCDEKKDKKRKRIHVETRDMVVHDKDETMTDAPPIVHSGLSSGLNHLMSHPPVLPLSPDYSGGDAGDTRHPSPGSPLKKSKQVKKRTQSISISNGLLALMSSKPLRPRVDERSTRKPRDREIASENQPKNLLEYTSVDKTAVGNSDSNRMVVYQPPVKRVELLLSFIDTEPDTTRGISMNKALKRYHRDRQTRGIGNAKAADEKELWRSLRMRRNDRGEIVLFT